MGQRRDADAQRIGQQVHYVYGMWGRQQVNYVWGMWGSRWRALYVWHVGQQVHYVYGMWGSKCTM